MSEGQAPTSGSDGGEIQNGVDVNVQGPADPQVIDVPPVDEPQATPEQLYAQAQAQIDILQRKNDFLRNVVSNQVAPTQTVPQQQTGQETFDPFENLPGTDVPNVLTVEQIIDQRMQDVNNQLFDARAKASYASAASRHSDYNEVAAMAREYVDSAADKDMLYGMIFKAEDPAELVYTLGKLHPEYLKRAVAAGTQKVVTQINNNLQRPATLSQTPSAASPTISLAQQISSMSDADFNAYKNRVLRGE